MMERIIGFSERVVLIKGTGPFILMVILMEESTLGAHGMLASTEIP